jgi:AraC-like DNA-binding protein
MGLRYREFAPPARLAPFVRCVWVFEADAAERGDAPDRIVPDASPELIVHFGAPFEEVAEGGGVRAQSSAVFAGQLSRPLWLRATGHAGVVGVRFRAAGARAFLAMPMIVATDARISIAELWPREARDLSDAVASARDAGDRALVVGRFVAARIERHRSHADGLVADCVDRIATSGERLAIDDLVRATGLSARQLERRFRDAVGVPPRLLASILRFRGVFDEIESRATPRWTQAALAAGYFDQSHMIRDFRRFVGCTPRDFLRATPGLSTAILTD